MHFRSALYYGLIYHKARVGNFDLTNSVQLDSTVIACLETALLTIASAVGLPSCCLPPDAENSIILIVPVDYSIKKY